MGKINYGLWRARKAKSSASVGTHCYVFEAFPSMESSPCAVDGTASRVLMCLELMNTATANLVYQNTTIKPSRAERRSGRRRRGNKIYLEFMLFAMLDFFLHEIPFLFEKTK